MSQHEFAQKLKTFAQKLGALQEQVNQAIQDRESVIHTACRDLLDEMLLLQAAQEDLQRQTDELAQTTLESQAALRLAAIVQWSDDAILAKTLDGIITDWNPGAQRIYGYTSSEVIGQPVSMLAPPEYKHEITHILEQIQHGITVDHLDTIRVRKDNTPINVSITVSPIKDTDGNIIGASTIAREITERKRMESEHQQFFRQLQAERAQLETVLQQMPAGVIIAAAPDGHAVLVNEQIKEITGHNFQPTVEIERYSEVRNFQTLHADGRPYAADEHVLGRAIRKGEIVQNEEMIVVRADGKQIITQANAAPIRNSKGEIIAGVAIIVDVTTRKRAEERTTLLQRITAAFAQAMTPEEVASVLTNDALPALNALAGFVALISDDGTHLQAISTLNLDADTAERVQSFPLTSEGVIGKTIITGQPIWIETQDTYRAQFPLHFERVEKLGIQAVASMPLVTEGRIIGGMTISFGEPQTFAEGDKAFIVSIVQQCEQALARVQLYEAEKRALDEAEYAVERMAHLQMITAALAEALTLEQVASVLTEHGTAALNARNIVLALLDESGDELRIVTPTTLRADLAERYRTMPVSPDALLGSAVLTGRPAWVKNIEEYKALYPRYAAVAAQETVQSVASIPLVAENRIIAVLTISYFAPQQFDEDDRAYVTTIAQQCAQALERARLYEAEREQRALAEALRDTAIALNSSLELEEVLNRILENIGRVVPHDTADVMLKEGATVIIVRSQGYARQGLVPNDSVMHRVRFTIRDTRSLYEAVETRRPVLIPDTKKYKGWVRLPESRAIRSHLSVPIIVDEDVLGFLNINSLAPNFFTEAHSERLRAFAHQAALAIQNSQLHQNIKELGVLQERQRLARDLHDVVSQTLFSASVIAEALPRQYRHNPEKVLDRLLQLSRMTRGALAEMRTLLLELRPASLLATKFTDLLKQLVEAARGRKEIKIMLTLEGEAALPSDVHIALYRMAQESLNNITKHAQATEASVTFRASPEGIELRVRDNGRGFNTQDESTGLGLDMMRERADEIGARLNFHSEAQSGTEIVIHWQPKDLTSV